MKPILFNTAMVRAILDGRKTVTRRAVKFKCGGNPNWTGYVPDGGVLYGSNNIPAAKAQYKPGDILYVRETWCDPSEMGYHPILYKADFPMHYDAEQTEFGEPIDLLAEDYTWKPSIHMPRDYARIFLRVTNVRVERLQDITADEIRAEGLTSMCAMVGDMEIALQEWRELWDSTIKKADKPQYGWDANPWVWVISFERISQEEAYHEIP